MKKKTTLMLMEITIAVLIFALAAALCLKAFSVSDNISRTSALAEKAVVSASNAAEILKANRGDFEKTAETLGGTLDSGIITLHQGEITVTVRAESCENPLLGGAVITAKSLENKELITLSVRWQREGAYE